MGFACDDWNGARPCTPFPYPGRRPTRPCRSPLSRSSSRRRPTTSSPSGTSGTSTQAVSSKVLTPSPPILARPRSGSEMCRAPWFETPERGLWPAKRQAAYLSCLASYTSQGERGTRRLFPRARQPPRKGGVTTALLPPQSSQPCDLEGASEPPSTESIPPCA